MTRADPSHPLATGIRGLDEVLHGGLIQNRIYLVDGAPGSGKTTLSLQFLMEGARRGERVLYITLSETEAELRESARSHGWSLEGIRIGEFIPGDDTLRKGSELTMYHSSEVELGETLRDILGAIEAQKPNRVIIDALSELRLLAESDLRYRRQLLALKRFFMNRACTVLMLDDRSATERDTHIESIAHGVISLELSLTPYGADQRRLRLRKLRGQQFRAGLHDYIIRTGGLSVFPRLVASEHGEPFNRDALPSGIVALDKLLGGGPQFGTSTLMIGPAGSGKTTVAMQYVASAVQRRDPAAVFMFDELRNLMVDRLEEIGINLAAVSHTNLLQLRQIDPTELSPGEFATEVLEAVDAGARLVVIDSLNGYLNAMPHDEYLPAQLHELLAVLGNRGVATILVVAQQGILGPQMPTPIDASYLADSIVLFRYFEANGEVHKAISVTKKRGGAHERSIRELTIDSRGVRVGDALSRFQGVLTGVPVLSASATSQTDETR